MKLVKKGARYYNAEYIRMIFIENYDGECYKVFARMYGDEDGFVVLGETETLEAAEAIVEAIVDGGNIIDVIDVKKLAEM